MAATTGRWQLLASSQAFSTTVRLTMSAGGGRICRHANKQSPYAVSGRYAYQYSKDWKVESQCYVHCYGLVTSHYTHYLCKFNCRNNRYGARAVGVLVQVPFWYCGKGNHAAFDIEIRRDSDERTNGLVILDGDT